VSGSISLEKLRPIEKSDNPLMRSNI